MRRAFRCSSPPATADPTRASMAASSMAAQGNSAVDASSFATSPHVTGVGGTDLADVLDGTTSQYFAPRPAWSVARHCPMCRRFRGTNPAATGSPPRPPVSTARSHFCKFDLKYDPNGYYVTSEAGSGGPSSVDASRRGRGRFTMRRRTSRATFPMFRCSRALWRLYMGHHLHFLLPLRARLQ